MLRRATRIDGVQVDNDDGFSPVVDGVVHNRAAAMVFYRRWNLQTVTGAGVLITILWGHVPILEQAVSSTFAKVC